MADAPLRIDPAREDRPLWDWGPSLPDTGIYVRALNSAGRMESADIARLDRESLKRWLRSRGGQNEWAEAVVLILLGHRDG